VAVGLLPCLVVNIDWHAAMNSPAIDGLLGALIGAVVGAAVTVVIGLKSLRVTREAARASERSADAGDRSAKAAEASARAAEESARDVRDQVRIEREREHERLGPGPVPSIETELETNPRLSTSRHLFGTLTVPRDYRVRAEAVTKGGSRTGLTLPALLHAGRSCRFHIEQWLPGRNEPEVEHILFRFWPPTDADEVEAWKCPCPRRPVDGDERGHWEWRAPVQYERGPMLH
jgi:gas vesicle protein